MAGFALTLLLLICPLLAQSQEEILRKIKSGEIAVPQELMKGIETNVVSGHSFQPTVAVSQKAKEAIITQKDDLLNPAKKNEETVLEKDTLGKNRNLQKEYKNLVDADAVKLGLKPFGFDIFARTVGHAAVNTAPSDDYILSVGDEVVIYTWGRENGQRSVFVDKDGFVNYPPLAPIRVAGLAFREAKTVVKSSLESISGLQARISLGQLSSVRVLLMGDVVNPGSYMITSGTTLINALFVCGGISDIGGLRQVRLERYGKPYKTFDLYNLLVHGSGQNDIQLVSGDIVFVPVAEKRVAVAGFVKRPAIYEARTGNKVSDMVRFAGGLSAEANGDRIVVERYKKNAKRVVLTFSMNAATGQIVNDVPVEDGDMIKVFPLLSEEGNAVVVTGHVKSPGKYEYMDGLTVKSILPTTRSFLPEAFFEYAVVKRVIPPEYHCEYIPFSLGRIYENSGSDFALKPMDTLFVFSRNELSDMPYIEVMGNIRKAGKLRYVRNMRVSDAVIAAGGYADDTYFGEAHIYRVKGDGGTGSDIVRVSLARISEDYNDSNNVILNPNDRLLIFSRWHFEFRDSVFVYGEVKKAGKYPFSEGMTVEDLVKLSGGYTESTYRLYVEIVRSVIEKDSVERERIIKLNFDKVPENGVAYKLEPRDEVFIRNIVDYGKTIAVKLNGLFVFPGVYRAEKGETISSIIARAGGFRSEAYLPGLIFSRVRVRERQQENMVKVANSLERELERMLEENAVSVSAEDRAYRESLINQRKSMLENLRSTTPVGRVIVDVKNFEKFKGSEFDIAVENGDELTVAENLNTVSVMGEVYAPISVVYSNRSNTVGECLGLAGGVKESGDANNIYLLRADGSVLTPKTVGLFSVFSWTEVGPGATIIVPPKTSKRGFWAEFEQVTRVIYQLAVTTGVVASVLK